MPLFRSAVNQSVAALTSNRLAAAFEVSVVVISHQAKIKERKDADRDRGKKQRAQKKAKRDSKNKNDDPRDPSITHQALKTFHNLSFYGLEIETAQTIGN